MQGYQCTGDERIHHRMQQLMYPETCGYRSVTGGLMERLREISVDQSKGIVLKMGNVFYLSLYSVRQYHKSYYRPDNLCLIITGKVDKDELLKALEPVEESIIKKGPLPEMQRPWVSTGNFPNLEKNIEDTVLFADEDESMGTLLIAWNGPMCNVSVKSMFCSTEYTTYQKLKQDFLSQKELEVLNVYLTDSSVSVLQKEFVETEESLCTDVDFYISDHLKSTLTFTASSVPIEEMERLPIEFFKTLNRLVEEEDIDMKRMATVIEKEILQVSEIK